MSDSKSILYSEEDTPIEVTSIGEEYDSGIEITTVSYEEDSFSDPEPTDGDGEEEEREYNYDSNNEALFKDGKINLIENEAEVLSVSDAFLMILTIDPDRNVGRRPVSGRLIATNYRLIFSPNLKLKREDIRKKFLQIMPNLPYGYISKLAKTRNTLEIECHGFYWRFTFKFSSKKSLKNMFSKLVRLVYPSTPLTNPKKKEQTLRRIFAFQYKTGLYIDEGWLVYDPFLELRRQGILNFGFWRVSDVNEKWQVCPTYPRVMAFPTEVTDEDIIKCSQFRHRGRLPYLTFITKDSVSLTRCSQPKVGLSRNRSKEDEYVIEQLRSVNIMNSDLMKIIDCRPKKNAIANQTTRKGGYESSKRYKNTQLEFLGIPNIHVMRNSLLELREIYSPADKFRNLNPQFRKSSWVKHLLKLIFSGSRIAKYIREDKTSVLVHCSDGWDRTSQVCSLAQILLDPYYRTIEGFKVLIEKDWLSVGHQFQKRLGLTLNDPKDTARSPIFLQFIDAVVQLLNAYPHEFEFNKVFLRDIMEGIYSLQFGTFLFNSDKERVERDLPMRTFSLWTTLRGDKYRRDGDSAGLSAEFKIDKNRVWRSVRFWSEYYSAYDAVLRIRAAGSKGD